MDRVRVTYNLHVVLEIPTDIAAGVDPGTVAKVIGIATREIGDGITTVAIEGESRQMWDGSPVEAVCLVCFGNLDQPYLPEFIEDGNCHASFTEKVVLVG